jgi:tetratricopeptide (TPR) repeat protein
MQICNDAFLAAGQRDAHFTLSDSRLSVNDRLRYIITVLNKNRFLLVLDNFEVNIDESTRKILDPELAGFYTYMISNLVGESRAIITSRYRPADVQDLPSIAQERTLGDFPESSFIKFLLLDEIVEQRYYKGEIPHDLLSKLYDLLGGTPRFLGQIRKVLKTIKAEELRSQLEAVTLPSKEKPTLLQQARDRYCEDIFTSRLYGYLNFDSQKALCRVAVYTIPVNLAGMRAVTGEPEEKVHSFTREWQDFALAYPEHEYEASELWTVYGLLRNWLLAPERLSPDDRKAAHKAAGDFLNEMAENDRTSELGMHPLYVYLEARAQYMFTGDYENAAEITERISGFYRHQGLYSEIQRLNEELLQYYEHPRILAQIAWSYLDRSSYAAARHWYQRMLDTAERTDEYEASRALYGLAMIDLNQGDYETAREKFQTALEIRQQIGGRAGEVEILHSLAMIDLRQGDYETARKKFQTALEIFQQIGDRAGEASTLHNLATIDLNQGDYETAREKFQTALEIQQQIGDRAGEAYPLHQIAMIDLNQGDYETAREKFQTALEIKQQIGDRAGEAYTLHNLATIDHRLGDYETAREKFQTALEIQQQIGDRAGEAYTLHSLATIDHRLGDYETAREKFQTALEIKQQIGDRTGEASSLHNLASIDLDQRDYETAREKFQTALEISQQIGDRAGEAKTWYQLGMLATEQDRMADGIKLVTICFLIEKSIDHADTENAFRALTGMASQLSYTEEQSNLMLKEVMEAYKKDRGSKLLEMAFSL